LRRILASESRKMTILQSICTNVEELLTANEVLEESSRQPADERTAFMITFAVYIEWIVLRTCRPLFDEKDYEIIASAVKKTIAEQNWFSIDLYVDIAPTVMERLDSMRPGRNTGVLLPMVHAIQGANSVGHGIHNSTDPTFVMYTLAAWKFLGEQIPKICGAIAT
jgi:hypothetical protein